MTRDSDQSVGGPFEAYVIFRRLLHTMSATLNFCAGALMIAVFEKVIEVVVGRYDWLALSAEMRSKELL